MHQDELERGEKNCVKRLDAFTMEVVGSTSTGVAPSSGPLEFDACWYPGTQDEVFEDAKDLVQSSVDGYNITIFAYGQTGAGKTFTMYGPPGHSVPQQDMLRGLCPRCTDELFAIVRQETKRRQFTVTMSMLELYQRRFSDLLDPRSKRVLRIRTQPNGETYVENATDQPVAGAEDVRRLVEAGIQNRHTRATQMNSESSRSHLIVCLRVISQNRQTGQKLQGKMLLVDLAGSERVKKSGVSGEGLREASEINKSLSALGDVIQAITRTDRHVPYRNHELTQVLQDSIGGTSKTLMFVNVAPNASSRDETMMSVKYAQRAKGVVNNPQIVNVLQSESGSFAK
jgi:hypothetical protein